MSPLSKLPLSIAFVFTFATPVAGQEGVKPQPFGRIVRNDPRFDKLIPKNAKLVKLAKGFRWCEGPAWSPQGRYILFSDIPSNKIFKYDDRKGLSTFMKQSGYTSKKNRSGQLGSNGLAFDAQGRLIICEHGDRRVTRIEKNGAKTVLASTFQGKRFNSPNDAVVDSKGNVYFTDPPYGLADGWNDPARELDFCGVYRISTKGELSLLTKSLSRPNGIGLSPDEKTLYVANSDLFHPVWMAFPIQMNGNLGKGRVFFNPARWYLSKRIGVPDGLAVDVHGNLFATGPGGVHVFTPNGDHLGTIDTGRLTSNCTFGGEDGSVLYITAHDFFCRIQTSTKGRRFGE